MPGDTPRTAHRLSFRRIVVLASMELVKTRYSLAALIAAPVFVFILGAVYADRMSRPPVRGLSTFALPEAWTHVLSAGAAVPATIVAALVAFLIATEFETDTEQQSLISGLSRKEFFAGKVVMWLGTSVIAYLVMVFIGGTLAWLATDSRGVTLVRFEDIALLSTGAISFLGFTSFAVWTAFATRHSVLAIGFQILYFSLIEPLVAAVLSTSAAARLPGVVFRSLLVPQIDAVQGGLVDRLPIWESLVGLGWMATFLALAYLSYRPASEGHQARASRSGPIASVEW